MTLLALIGLIAVLQLVSLKAGTYRTSSRLANMNAIEERFKWELMSRWGREV